MIKKSFCVLLFIAVFSGYALTSLTVFAQPTTPGTQTPATPVAGKKLSEGERDKLVLEHLALKDQIKRCAIVEDRGIRISCYDNIAKNLGYISADRIKADEETLGKVGFWQMTRKTGDDGVVQTYLRLESSNVLESRSGTERQVVLVIRCVPGKTDVFLDWKAPVATGALDEKDSKKLLTYFTAPHNKITEDWEISADQYALFSLDSVSFVRNILKKQKLTMQFAPEGSNMQSAHFDIGGVDTGIDTIVKSCY